MARVVIGNIYDSVGDFDVRAAHRTRARMQRLRASAAAAGVWNASTGALEDQSGLTMRHTLDPAVQAEVHRLSEGLRGRGFWVAALGGLVLGLLLAGLIWWMNSQAQGGRGRR